MARPSTRFGWFVQCAMACSCAVVLASCGGVTAPTTPGTGTAALPSSTAPGETGSTATSVEPATAAPSPEFAATTEPATGAPEGAVAVEMAGPPPHYLRGNLTIRAGDAIFFLTNNSLAAHNLAIDRARLVLIDGRVKNVPLVVSGTVAVGTSATFVVDRLVPGDYFIWCTLSDHAALGMTGTLTVTP